MFGGPPVSLGLEAFPAVGTTEDRLHGNESNTCNETRKGLRWGMQQAAAEIVAHGFFSRAGFSKRVKVLGLSMDDGPLVEQLLSDFCRIRPPFDKMWLEGLGWACAVNHKDGLVGFLPFALRLGDDGSQMLVRGKARHIPYDDAGAPVESMFSAASMRWPADKWKETRGPHERIAVVGAGRFTAAQLARMSEADKDVLRRELLQEVELTEGSLEALIAKEKILSQEQRELYCFMAGILAVATLSFMHCKNIKLADEVTTRAERRRLQKIGLGPVYKVLNLHAMGRQQSAGGESGGSRLTRLHLVRGHFATWTDSAPLFGKYTGTWWVPAHGRGRAEIGTVAKAYAIDPA